MEAVEIKENTQLTSQENITETINLLFADISQPKQSFTYSLKPDDLQITMRDLLKRFTEERKCIYKIVDLFGCEIQKNKSIGFYRNLQPFYIEATKAITEDFSEFDIQVKTLTGKTINLKVNPFMTIEDVKDLIQAKEGIPPDQMKLIYGKSGLRDHAVLSDIGVTNGAVLNLILNLRGGGASGLSFVDITQEDKAVVREWSQSAPRWRTITAYGLCLEGICKNSKCQAFGHWVIISKGTGYYDLINDKKKNLCPQCYQPVVPEKCAFTNCIYSFVGTKLEPGKPLQKVVSPKEIEVGDHYKLFDPEDCGKADWISLKIITKSLVEGNFSSKRYVALKITDIGEICGVCCKEIQGAGQHLDCAHKFHDECYQKLKDLNIKCSICHF